MITFIGEEKPCCHYQVYYHHDWPPVWVYVGRSYLKSSNSMNEQTELLREMRDILLVMAEPALAQRDEKRRAILQGIVGKSKPKGEAVLLMDGTRSQSAIKVETGIDAGGLSRCVKALREASLLSGDENPKLLIVIPPNFFDQKGDA